VWVGGLGWSLECACCGHNHQLSFPPVPYLSPSNPPPTHKKHTPHAKHTTQALPEDERSTYVARADALKAESGGGKKGKKTGDSGGEGPKLPRSAYQLFCNEERGALAKGLNVGEQAKELSAKWKALGEEGKAVVAARLEEMRREAAAGGEGEM
jgi:hypothetical protein